MPTSRWRGMLALRWLYGPPLGMGMVIVTAALVALVERATTLPHLSIIFVAPILVAAVLFGLVAALCAALVAVSLSGYLLYPPHVEFGVAEAQDLLDLVIFVAVAVTGSWLAAAARREAQMGARREALITALHQFSQRLAAIADPNDICLEVLDHLEAALDRRAFLLLPADDGRFAVLATRLEDHTLPPADLATAEALWRGDGVEAPRFHLLRTGRGPIAMLVLGTATEGVPGADPRLVAALVDQAAIGVERAQLAVAIEDARVKDKAEKLREALLNSVSHDFQTPLAAIIGAATTLESFGAVADEATRADLVVTIREEAERLARFIANLLDLGRIRGGALHPRPEAVELADIVDAALRQAGPRLARHRVGVALPLDLAMIRADPLLLEHALVNLLENAAKYSGDGSAIRLQATGRGDSIELAVADQGVGIAAAELPMVFDRYYRGGDHDARPAGAGLGLTIARAFVEACGGGLTVESAGVGHGATFRINLPAAQGRA